MRDVAALAGVSLATVSRVVNGGGRVDAAIAARVTDAVELLGYRHNVTASSLRRADQVSASIGVVFEDISNPFFAAVHRGVEDVAREHGVLTFTGSSDENPARERELAEAFVARSIDGLIVAPSAGDHSYLAREQAHGLALTFVDRPPRFLDADAVVSDNRGGARAAVSHLAARGHQRIGYIGDRPELFTSAERFTGYQLALAAHGLAEDRGLVRHPRHRAMDAYELVRELLLGSDPPTALFTSQNLITIAAVKAVHDLGLQHSVAMVGFDDVDLAEVVTPAITVVAQDARELGTRAAHLLFERLRGYDGPTRQIVVPTPLIVRGSGEITA